MADLKVTVWGKGDFKSTTEQEIIEIVYINKFQAISEGLNNTMGFKHITIVN